MTQNKTVLITGAAGFIGSHVADHCLKLGFKVVATDNLSGAFRENVPAGAEFTQGDLLETGTVAGAAGLMIATSCANLLLGVVVAVRELAR